MSCQHDSRRIRATRNAETDDLKGRTGLVQVCSPEQACGGMVDSDWLTGKCGFGNVEDEEPRLLPTSISNHNDPLSKANLLRDEL